MESAQKGPKASSGARKGGGKSKSMKRCSSCGAKNKGSFEYCIRCSEPLGDGAADAVDAPVGGGVPKIFLGGIALLVVVVVAAVLMRSGPEAPPPATTATGDAPPPAPRPAPTGAEIDSPKVLASFHAALAAYNEKDYSNAAGLFQDVIQEIPGNPSAHQYLGLCYAQLQQYPEALSALEEARKLKPDSFELLDDYVTTAKKASDLEKAATALRDFVQRNPKATSARLELSRIARSLGRADEALEQASFLASSSQASPEFQYEYGVSLKEAGKLDEALTALKSAVELDPNSAAAHHALGVTEFLAGKPGEALGPLQQAVAKAPDNGDFRFSLAQVYEKLDRIPESLAAYEAYLQHAKESDPRAKVVRERLEVAKKALAERNAAGKS